MPLLASSNGAHADGPWHQGRGSTSPLALRRCIGSNWLGVVERIWLISLWRSAKAEIGANSGVPPWLKASVD
ncbi:hypothetical protein IVA93_39130 (plasmid) [Bradyrhizobium sp. 155]|uniref:hypothetical protein n=1 Tax=unclassified Bradyrhizobium TaxID=2631580 RepID=UPI001FFAF12C|nr:MULTISPECIES: hypothetical protein [unclassified Bradyrhizobium]MCK1326516.1 hypothetical protein [Bradyrhizobium sp. 156]UPK16005.1 hypothetical protein IVA93_39130 [Bradyrhizobium sp. 155]